MALVPPAEMVPRQRRSAPIGLAAIAGALADDWDDVEADLADVVAARANAVDRPAPDLG